jgi:Helix-turn-helix domain
MLEKRRWLPCWQRVVLVEKCLQEGMTRREAAAWRRVSVSTVQYWIGRYRGACKQEQLSGAWAADRSPVPRRQPARCSGRCTVACARRAGARAGARG